MRRTLIVVYSKIPGCGAVKTRLGLAPRDATRLQRASLLDTLDLVARVPNVDVELAYAPPARRTEARAYAARCRRQRGRTLGDRLEHTIADARRRGYAHVIVIGSDSPTLPLARIHAARCALTRVPVVLGPAQDGGFYLLASRIAFPRAVLADIPWSSGRECASAVRALRARGVRTVRIASWYDIDEPRDLARVARHMRAAPRTQKVIASLQRSKHASGLRKLVGTASRGTV